MGSAEPGGWGGTGGAGQHSVAGRRVRWSLPCEGRRERAQFLSSV